MTTRNEAAAHALLDAIETISDAVSGVHNRLVACGSIQMPTVESVPLEVLAWMGRKGWLEPHYCGYDEERGAVSVRLTSPRCRIKSLGGVAPARFFKFSKSLRSGEWD